MSKKVIVIGSGVGGLATAARLLSKGYKVTIIEKNESIGGRTNQIIDSGFKFDLSASILMLPKDYIELFTYCNKDYKDYFELIPLENTYRCVYPDNTYCDFGTSFPMLTETINNYSDSIDNYLNFLSASYKKHLLAEKFFLNKSLNGLRNMINVLSISKIIETNPFSTCSKHISKYIKDEKLANYLLFQSMYIGVSPYSSSNIYNLIPAVSNIYGLYYIKGGIYSYIKAIKCLILELGGEIITSEEVEKILIKDNTAYGVRVSGEDKLCDIVVSNADFMYSVSTLIDNNILPKKYKDTSRFEHSCSTFILYLGLDKKYPFMNIHNICIGEEFKENIEAPFKGNISKEPSMYIYCPTAIDSTMAPPNCEAINIMVRVPNLSYENINWEHKSIDLMIDKILNRLSLIPQLVDIKNHIVHKEYTTPEDFENKYNCFWGNAFGLSHTLNQVNNFRPQSKIKGINNLYFTGASTHPGNGISMVIKSSKICCETILKEFNY